MTTQAPDTTARAAIAPDTADGPMTGARVVVGVDDGGRSRDALRWALRVAAGLGWTVDVVTVWPDREAVFIHEVPGHPNDHRHRAVEAQRRALDDVVEARSCGTPVRTFVENARPVDALVAHSRGAVLVVVGAPRTPLRSTHAEVSRRVDCPVVVVETPPGKDDQHEPAS